MTSYRHGITAPSPFFIGAPRHAEAAITNLEARPSRAKSLGSVAESRPLSPARLSPGFEYNAPNCCAPARKPTCTMIAPIICPAHGSSLRCDTVALESESNRLIRQFVSSDRRRNISFSVHSHGIELRFQRGKILPFSLRAFSSLN